MSSVAFMLRVPADAPYRVLAGEVAARYVEVIGGAATLAAALASDVSRAVEDLAPFGDVDLAFSRTSAGIEVALTSGDQHRRCTLPL